MIRDLPAPERLRERLRTGTPSESVLSLSSRLLAQFGGRAGLARVSYDELARVHGFGEAKIAQLKAAFELGRRLLSLQENERTVFGSPQDVANLLQGEMAFLEQEHLRVGLLNTRCLQTHSR
jgi:DNA repair protein RadC